MLRILGHSWIKRDLALSSVRACVSKFVWKLSNIFLVLCLLWLSTGSAEGANVCRLHRFTLCWWGGLFLSRSHFMKLLPTWKLQPIPGNFLHIAGKCFLYLEWVLWTNVSIPTAWHICLFALLNRHLPKCSFLHYIIHMPFLPHNSSHINFYRLNHFTKELLLILSSLWSV